MHAACTTATLTPKPAFAAHAGTIYNNNETRHDRHISGIAFRASCHASTIPSRMLLAARCTHAGMLFTALRARHIPAAQALRDTPRYLRTPRGLAFRARMPTCYAACRCHAAAPSFLPSDRGSCTSSRHCCAPHLPALHRCRLQLCRRNAPNRVYHAHTPPSSHRADGGLLRLYASAAHPYLAWLFLHCLQRLMTAFRAHRTLRPAGRGLKQ